MNNQRRKRLKITITQLKAENLVIKASWNGEQRSLLNLPENLLESTSAYKKGEALDYMEEAQNHLSKAIEALENAIA